MTDSEQRAELSAAFLTRALVFGAFKDSLAGLAPRVQLRDAATLGVYIGSILASTSRLRP